MKKTALSFFFCGFLMLSTLVGQEVKLGEITKEDLSETKYANDSSAVAAYLYKYRNTYIDGTNLVTEIHHILKFYHKDGLEFASKKIRLSKNGSAKENVSGMKAFTYNLEGGKIVKESLSKDAIFKSEYHKSMDHYTFTMPKVKEGSIIEYKYKLVSPFYSSIDPYQFQHAIPVKKLYAKLYTPRFFKFKRKMKGYLAVQPKFSTKKDHRLGAEVNVQEYIMSDIPALKEEAYVDNIENYRSGIEYELVAVHNGTYVKSYAQTWTDVAKSVNDLTIYKSDLKKKSYYQKELDVVLADISDPTMRMNAIFSFVKDKMKWNEVDGIYTYNGLSKAYKTGTGNTGDINLMLISMMRYAQLEANPVLLSTRDNGISFFPTMDGLNYVICGVKIDGKNVLLDATNKFASPNILPVRVMNWFGKMIKPNDTFEDVLLNPRESSTTSVIMQAFIDDEGSLKGKVRTSYSQNAGFGFRSDYAEESEDEYLQTLESNFADIEIDEYELKGLKDLDKPIVESFSFEKEEHVEIVNDKMLLTPMLFFATTTNPFTKDERLFPIDFAYPRETKYRISIKIPEGYDIESMPASAKMALPDELGDFSLILRASPDNRSIQLICSSKFNRSKISQVHYKILKEYFQEMIIKESEKIVLRAKT